MVDIQIHISLTTAELGALLTTLLGAWRTGKFLSARASRTTPSPRTPTHEVGVEVGDEPAEVPRALPAARKTRAKADRKVKPDGLEAGGGGTAERE
jgi:hypothetical protein